MRVPLTTHATPAILPERRRPGATAPVVAVLALLAAMPSPVFTPPAATPPSVAADHVERSGPCVAPVPAGDRRRRREVRA